MSQYSEAELSNALNEVTRGVSIHNALKNWGIPRSTLRYRLQGTETRQDGAQHLQLLSPSQETILADYCLVQEAISLGLNHQQIKHIAQQLLAVKGDSRIIGKRWINRFITRNPVLRTKQTYKIDFKRANGATIAVIQNWFCILTIPQLLGIPPERRYNMDEGGVMEGLGKNGLIVGAV